MFTGHSGGIDARRLHDRALRQTCVDALFVWQVTSAANMAMSILFALR
jgi:hypothetical protein